MLFFCGREGIQTPNLLIRSQMLYSVELRNHFPEKEAAKITKNPMKKQQNELTN